MAYRKIKQAKELWLDYQNFIRGLTVKRHMLSCCQVWGLVVVYYHSSVAEHQQLKPGAKLWVQFPVAATPPLLSPHNICSWKRSSLLPTCNWKTTSSLSILHKSWPSTHAWTHSYVHCEPAWCWKTVSLLHRLSQFSFQFSNPFLILRYLLQS